MDVMTPEELEQMRVDIAAGTPGPWVAASPEQDPSIVSVEGGGFFIAWIDEGYDNAGVNARRIARVPSLEADLLRLMEKLAKMQRSRDRYREAWETEKRARAAIGLGDEA
jgi:hypothetical protein